MRIGGKMKIDPIELEIAANRKWQKAQTIQKAQKAILEILESYPSTKHAANRVLEQEKERAIDELKEFQDSYNIAILIEKSEHEKVIADMVEDVVDEKHIIEKVIEDGNTARTS
jgi:hypothetical protein